MKKILGLTVAALLVMGLVGGGTWAYFSDVETSTGNIITAGTLDLQLAGGTQVVDSVTQTWTLPAMKPGDTGGTNGALTITNNGTIAGFLNISNVTHIVDQVTNHPESKTHTGKSAEDLFKVWIFFDENANGIKDGSDVDIYGTSGAYAAIGSMPTSCTVNQPLAASPAHTHITLKYDWPSSADDNDAQGDIITFGFTVELSQNSIP